MRILFKINKRFKLNRKIIFGKKKIDIYDNKFSNNKITKLVQIKKKHDIYREVNKIIDYYS